MSERILSTTMLTAGESMVVKLVDAIKAKSLADFSEGLPENKDLDRWGAELVNSPEYASAMGKIGASRETVTIANTEIDY